MLIGAASRTVDLVDDVIVPILKAGENRTLQLVAANVLIESQQKPPVVGIYRVSHDTLVIPVAHRDCCLATYDGSFQGSRHTLKFVIERGSRDVNTPGLFKHRGCGCEVPGIRELDHVRSPTVNVVQSIVYVEGFVAPSRRVDAVTGSDRRLMIIDRDLETEQPVFLGVEQTNDVRREILVLALIRKTALKR